MNLKQKFRGALLGTGIGDSLGRAFEGFWKISPSEVGKVASQSRVLRYTDDTQQMMGVAESLAEKGSFDGEHMAKTLAKNFDPSRGYGPGSSRVLLSISRGGAWDEPAKGLFGGSGSYGNGSSMRVAPVGLLFHDDLDGLLAIAQASSKITHTHKLGVEGAVLQAHAVGLAVKSDPSKRLGSMRFLKRLQSSVAEEIYEDKLSRASDLLGAGPSRSEVVRSLGNGVEAFNSVPTAIYSFLSHPASFEDAVTYAVGLGGDADTIGAMTGSISGAYLGSENIPDDWRRKLEDGDRIEKLADSLLQARRS